MNRWEIWKYKDVFLEKYRNAVQIYALFETVPKFV